MKLENKTLEVKVKLDISELEKLLNTSVQVDREKINKGLSVINKILKEDIENEKFTPLEFTYLNNLALELETTILLNPEDEVLLVKFPNK
ncbi:hypothetical protein D7X33_22400 [Butyricicoccus sp. 1XD8-22]|nr:hypothetical protein D7X33_22400 [Butyricicoccus sp. 1XD8-22]